jgi:hypothetical protein
MTERVVTLEGPVPNTPSISQVDAIMREVSAQLGEKWLCTRLSGVWVFQQEGAAGTTSRRRFPNALADCLQVAVGIRK